MIEIANREIVIDGTPRLLISGEIHYFRLRREEWQDRLDKAKRAGCNTVASYIPWLVHELENGEFDLDGHSRPELDLGAFIDLCAENALFFIARPGPFVMAEMKNEGLPYRLYEEHPEIVPVGWDGAPASTRTVDYLAPAFLAEARTWYAQVMPLIAERLHPRGPVIGVQLDNEVGMLSWVSNTPDLTDNVIADFWRWLREQEGDAAVAERYPSAANDPAAIRSPEEAWVGAFTRDLGWYMRDRFARYFAELRRYVEEFGVRDVPFFVNIHGTEAGGGEPFAIGISQLYESYTREPGFLAGSDHYLGHLSIANLPDLYLINAFMDAVNRPEQPLTSMEFEAGAGDYSSSFDARNEPSDTDFKIRMSLAQGNRLLNYYLFTGGINYRMERQYGDGNDRISFTGERHGTGAPVNPEGKFSYTFDRLARVNTTALAVEDKLTGMREEHDNLAIGFIPDYWMTESRYPKSELVADINQRLRDTRFGGPRRVMARSLLLSGFRFGAIDIQNRPLPQEGRVLALAPALYMAAEVQRKIVDFLRFGGKALFHGELPRYDMTGAPCTILLDALGLEPVGRRESTHQYFLSLTAASWGAPRAEIRAAWAQTFRPTAGTIFHVYGADEAAGFDCRVGEGRAIMVTADIPAELDFFARALPELGTTPGLRHDVEDHGIFLTSTVNDAGERFLHLLNLDNFDKHPHLQFDGQPIAEGRAISLRARDGVMLPFGLAIADGVRIVWSTAEIAARDEASVTFRLTGDEDAVLLETEKRIALSDDYTISEPAPGRLLITSRLRGTGNEHMTVRWESR
jgi:beta-galactosidase